MLVAFVQQQVHRHMPERHWYCKHIAGHTLQAAASCLACLMLQHSTPALLMQL
jgi:hypothetical protein